MTLAIDGSSPAGKTLTTTAAITSASFTPPSGALIVAGVSTGNSAGSGAQGGTISDSLSGTWAAADKTANTTGQGDAEIFHRSTLSNGSAMTVTWTPSGTNGKGTNLKVWVFTGQNASPIGATASTLTGVTGSVSITSQTNTSIVVVSVTYTNASVTWATQSGTTTDNSTGDSTNGEAYAQGHATGTGGAQTVGYTNSTSSVAQVVAVEILASTGAATRASMPENYKYVTVGDGMGTGERIR